HPFQSISTFYRFKDSLLSLFGVEYVCISTPSSFESVFLPCLSLLS
ncbi:unnamed protein product, partial [Brassica rapa]